MIVPQIDVRTNTKTIKMNDENIHLSFTLVLKKLKVMGDPTFIYIPLGT
jgi:hypothetical protein